MFFRSLWGHARSGSHEGVSAATGSRGLDPQINADTDGNVRVSHITHILAVLVGVQPPPLSAERQPKMLRAAALHLYEKINPLVWDGAHRRLNHIIVQGYVAHSVRERALVDSPVRLIEFLGERVALPVAASIVFQEGACKIAAPLASGKAEKPSPALHVAASPSSPSRPTRFILATVLRGGGHIVLAREKPLCPLA